MKQPMAAAFAAAAIAAATCVGFVAGRFTATDKVEPTPAGAKPDDVVAKKLADAHKRIAELEDQTAKLRGKLTKKLVARANSATNRGGGKGTTKITGDNINIIDELKSRLPEDQFSQVTNAMEQLKTSLARKAKGRMDFLASVDTSSMTEDERKNHERFLELMERKEAVAAKMKGIIPNAKAIQEMVEIEMAMRQTAKRERSTLVRQVAKELGYTGDDVDVIHDTLCNVYDCTSGGGIVNIGDIMDAAVPAEATPGDVGDVETVVSPPVIEIHAATP